MQIKAPLQVLLKTFASMPGEILEGVIFWQIYIMDFVVIYFGAYVTIAATRTVSGWLRSFLVCYERR